MTSTRRHDRASARPLAASNITWVSAKIFASSCSDLSPLERSTALCSHLRPNSRRKTPTTVRAASMEMCDVIASPNAATSATKARTAAMVPVNALLHPLTRPTARTMVSASTHSTPAARNVARITRMLIGDGYLLLLSIHVRFA